MKLADVEAILRALNDAKARYLIVGGLAMDGSPLEGRALSRPTNFYWNWRRRRGALQNPGPQFKRLDIFVREPFDFEAEYAAAERLDVAGISSPVLRMEALMLMKQQAGRPKDLGDVGELEKLLDIRNDESAEG